MRIAVTDITFDFVKASPIDPNINPANNRARYGRLANIPAWAMLKPKTCYVKVNMRMLFIWTDLLTKQCFESILRHS